MSGNLEQNKNKAKDESPSLIIANILKDPGGPDTNQYFSARIYFYS
ncbi:hypothetical protein [Acetobacterium bakii]|nr:hypothetical protein [Acetobacterium bakii]